MKKFLSAVILITVISLSVKAQITLESSQYNGQLRIIHLERAGFKYAIENSNQGHATQFSLYNLNHTLYKTFNIGPVPAGADSWQIQYVTETLWDTDSTNIDYAVVGMIGGTSPAYFTRIYHENGNLIFSNDSATFFYGVGGPFGNPVSVPIFNSDSGTKMILWYWPSNTGIQSLVYCLPGKLECMQCYDNVNSCEDVLNAPNMLMGKNILNPYPNPTANTTTIPYDLPEGENTGEIVFYNAEGKEVTRFKVDRTFNQITISSAELAPGTYYYQLQTEKNVSGGKKLVIIK